MTTVTQLRNAIISAAEDALKAEPTDPDKRVRSFVARLSGSMVHLDERTADKAVWALVDGDSTSIAQPTEEPPS